ncbi:MAG: hypothetical protein P8N51_00335 [Pseudomonadales bacterium]|nr:hypothetical protein [Pseudomonadales bacterium]MDG1441077.1 hypothetical protein [Pseudomonadales bacterium]
MNQSGPVYLGSVNRWECDENDHLNVRFFGQKMQQTLEAGLLEYNLVTPQQLPIVRRSISSQHMRFIAEARIAVPISGYLKILSVDTDEFTVLVELRNTGTDTVMAAFVYVIEMSLAATNQALEPMPAYAGSRGIETKALTHSKLNLAQSHVAGFSQIGRGIIRTDECDEAGSLQPYHYIGKSSDSMPNLWARFTPGENERGKGVVGGAVLEYRMDHHGILQPNDRFEMVSGILSLGEKTQHMLHLIYNVETGQCVVTCQAVAVTMDLVARKSMPIPDDRRAVMQNFLI